MSLRLPEHPNLDVLRRQAKAVLRVGRLLHETWRLSDAQRALARGYGRSSWSELKESVKAEGRRTFVGMQRAAECVDDGSRAEPPAPASSNRLTGSWVSRSAGQSHAALEVAESTDAFWLTQVDMAAVDGPVAGCLLLRVDGQEHGLGVNTNEHLRIKTFWVDERKLRTTVTHHGVTVSEGTYALSGDGEELTVVGASGQLVLHRVASKRDRAAGFRRAAGAVVAAAFLACCGCATIPTSSGVRPRTETHDKDRSAIEALNRHDISAALASDIEAVASQWTEDFVVLPPAGPIVRGRAANLALMTSARPQLEKLEPTAYTVDFDEIVVTGDYAFAWGLFRAVVRPRAGGPDVVSSGKLLRVYQRQPDGRWLMHRTMSTMDARTP
jgi:ketosteroid isomerase-like protein